MVRLGSRPHSHEAAIRIRRRRCVRSSFDGMTSKPERAKIIDRLSFGVVADERHQRNRVP
jgi:hypothetical protein